MKDNSIPHVHIDDHPKLVKEGIFVLSGEVWSTQKRIAQLYGRSIPTVNDHLKKIFREKELIRGEAERKLMITQKEGRKQVTRTIFVYNTDAVIALGFRVKGEWGKEFRVWAREIVRQSYNPKDQIRELLK
jgi:hypothetical protein